MQDFLGGHIKGAVNVSSDKFADDDDVADTIAEYVDGKGKNTVIVHCALSQQRGPFCAERCEQAPHTLACLRDAHGTYSYAATNSLQLLITFSQAFQPPGSA
jgi:Rhodanese-like domain